MVSKTFIHARMIAPGSLLMVGTFVAQVIVNRFGFSPLLVGMQKPMLLVSLGLMGAGSMRGLWAIWRLWRWEAGSVSEVFRCGGLLGQERSGRYGAYRHCLACNRNVNERHWA